MRKFALTGAAAVIAFAGFSGAANAAWHGGWGGHYFGPRVGFGFYAPLWVPPPVVYAPPPVIVEPRYVAPAAPAAAYAPPPAGGMTNGTYWYYCNNPQGYYPYVRMCNSQWQTVSANPDADGPR